MQAASADEVQLSAINLWSINTLLPCYNVFSFTTSHAFLFENGHVYLIMGIDILTFGYRFSMFA